MKTLIIAEAGVNHNGDIELAKKLIDVASEAGADFVKFQTFKASKLVSREAKKADYQTRNYNNGDDSQFSMLESLELTENNHHILSAYCKNKGVKFLSTGFDEESIDFLDEFGIELFKIPSGEITNKPYLKHVASKGKPIIISTGMSSLSEIKNALSIFIQGGIELNQIRVLHCNTEYPTPFEDVNLRAMNTIASELGVQTGYSDHTLGIEVPIAAVSLGAVVIEKHFTLDRNMEGPDHKASLEPNELKSMITSIRNIENAISGDGIKKPSKSEKKNLAIVRKSIHLNTSLKNGCKLEAIDLIMKRPGDGISPMEVDNVIGKTLTVDLNKDSKLEWKHLT